MLYATNSNCELPTFYQAEHSNMIYDHLQTPVDAIRRINEFMKTGCTDELIHQIADVTAFSKMRIAKSAPDAKARLLVKTVCVSYML